FRVLMISRCASTTCPHQPPSGRNLMKPSLVIDFTRKPTSSRCPASMTFGPFAAPTFSQMKLPSRSRLNSPTPSRCLFITSATSSSKPGTPCASTSSLRKSRVRSMDGVSPAGVRVSVFIDLLVCGRAREVGVGPGQVEHPAHELVIRDALGLRCHGHEARGRHTGHGVHLEHERLVVLGEPEVHAHHAAAAEHGGALHGQLADVAAQLLVEYRGADVLGLALRVLRFVIVETALRLDLDDRERLLAHD